MPAPDTQHPNRLRHWYCPAVQPIRPKQFRRLGASAIINGLNAMDYWAHGDDPTYLLGCMRVQISNLWELALHSDLPQTPNDEKTAVVALLKECRDALFSLHPLTPQPSAGATASPTASQAPMPSTAQVFTQPIAFTPTISLARDKVRTANTSSHIESNAKAALGAVAYLADVNLFDQQGQALYGYIQYRLQQVIALMEGSVTLGEVVSERQRLMSQQQQGQSPQATPSLPATLYQAVPLTETISSSGMETGQVPPASPVKGLEAKPAPWSGTSNRDESGAETVGSRQDWYSTYGTTLEQFAARCTKWLQANGGGQAELVAHLRVKGVPDNVIGQVLPYV